MTVLPVRVVGPSSAEVSHHKAAAGALARELNLIFGVYCGRKVFIDCDDLQSLQTLLVTVEQDVRCACGPRRKLEENDLIPFKVEFSICSMILGTSKTKIRHGGFGARSRSPPLPSNFSSSLSPAGSSTNSTLLMLKHKSLPVILSPSGPPNRYKQIYADIHIYTQIYTDMHISNARERDVVLKNVCFLCEICSFI